ncbi:MAG: hypothetical protein GY940_04585, partial [bacterium]|nr:hypothetical protein [bacterium]
ILDIEARRMRAELLVLRNRLRSLLEDKDDRNDQQVLNNRYFIRDYLNYFRGFKKSYFNMQSENYIKIARHLQNQKVDKWVFNFFQLGMFYYPKMLDELIGNLDPNSLDIQSADGSGNLDPTNLDNQNEIAAGNPEAGASDSQLEGLELTELYQTAYNELQGTDQSLVTNISKFFLNTEASFHTQLMRNRNKNRLIGFEFHPIALDSENIFLQASRMTGGIISDSNKIESFVKKVADSEDIYYNVTYNPGKYKDKNQKIKIMVDGKPHNYKVFYDDMDRARYLDSLVKKEDTEMRRIYVKSLDFSDGILSFVIDNIKLVSLGTGKPKTGSVLVKIKIIDSDSKILYARERKVTFNVEKQQIKIRNLPRFKKGMYDFLVEAHDMATGRNDLAIEDFRVR